MSTSIAVTLDLKNLACPLPIVKAAKALRERAEGDLVEVHATDPGSVPDFKAWCLATGNQLVEWGETGGEYRFVIRKK